MILPALVSLLVAVAPILRGAWDPWAQALLQLAVVAGLTLWLLSRVALGYVPLPTNRLLLWVGALAGMAALSVWRSPIPGLAKPEWHNFLVALAIFPAMAALTKDERTWIDQTIRVAAWTLMMLAFYQHFTLRDPRPASAFPNENIWAAAILMLVPLALERRDWLLFLGLLWSLCWTHSLGAWLGLSGALALTQRRDHPAWARVGLFGVCVAAVLVYARLDTPEVLHRWGWWRAAAAMAADRPLSGYGPGTFRYVLAAYRDLSPYGLYSLYAHHAPLQLLAELGPLCGIVWLGGVAFLTVRAGSHKGFALVAAIGHSLWDYGLLVPSNFWLFSYCAASTIPDTARGVNVPSAYRVPTAILVLALGGALCRGVWAQWAGQRFTALAGHSLIDGRPDDARRWSEAARRFAPDDPERSLVAAEIELASGSPGRPPLAAAAALEEAGRLNPYRSATWTELSLVYRRLGRPELAKRASALAGASR